MKVFKSKIGFAFFIMIAILGYLSYSTFMNKIWIGFSIIIAVLLFLIHLAISTYYTIRENILEVRCSFLYYSTFKISEIKKITEISDMFSAPAISLDRLLIKFNDNQSIAISPNNKSEFIQLLKQINPTIEVELSK